MATRHGRSRRSARLRCEVLEQRDNPAAVTALDFGAGFTPDRLPGGLPAGYAAGDLLLTDGPFQARAVWAPTPVRVRTFHTSFVFQQGEDNPASNGAKGDGFTFALVSSNYPPRSGVAGGGLGYQGLTESVAVKFDLVDNAGEGTDSVGVFTGGADPTTPADRLPAGMHLNSGDVFRVGLTYAAGVLHLDLQDTATGASFARSYAVDIAGAVGGPTAYAGFTAGTGSLSAPIEILDWTYTPAANS